MTKNDKIAVISKIYKFESISTWIYAITLISCHLELNRVKQSYFEFQNGNTRTYASRLSTKTFSMALIWILATAVLYLSLTLIYGNFTWYFVIPTVLLGLISGVYLA